MIDPEKILHISPIDDLQEHILKCEYPAIGDIFCPCKCEPKYQREGEGLLVIHNSFDGREAVEEFYETLNSTDGKK